MRRTWLLIARFLAVVAMIALDCVLLRRSAPVAAIQPQPSRRTFADTRDDVHLWLYRRGLVDRPPGRLTVLIDYEYSSLQLDAAFTEIEFDAPAK
ncbi:MAG: hypothetical protein HYS13_18010 [Planctomycetia bacterium]|nr:hypothetical protein [Planctomycetia bacterium]